MTIKRTILGLVAALAAGLGVVVICVAVYTALLSYPVYRHITDNWYLEFDAD